MAGQCESWGWLRMEPGLNNSSVVISCCYMGNVFSQLQVCLIYAWKIPNACMYVLQTQQRSMGQNKRQLIAKGKKQRDSHETCNQEPTIHKQAATGSGSRTGTSHDRRQVQL